MKRFENSSVGILFLVVGYGLGVWTGYDVAGDFNEKDIVYAYDQGFEAGGQATHEGTTAISHKTLIGVCGVKDISQVLIRDGGIYCLNGADYIRIQPEFTFEYTGGTDDK